MNSTERSPSSRITDADSSVDAGFLPDLHNRIESPYRSLVGPLLQYIEGVRDRYPDAVVTVALPEYVPAHWWEQLQHNQTALRIKAALLFRPGIVVTSVPWHLDGPIPPGGVQSAHQ